MRALTNKQVLVLQVLRGATALTCQEIADRISKETICPLCNGESVNTGERWYSRTRCEQCYGRGYLWFDYSKAHVALRTLMKRGLVTRTWMKDQWGDEIPRHLYSAVAEAEIDPSDPLEKLWLIDAGREAARRTQAE